MKIRISHVLAMAVIVVLGITTVGGCQQEDESEWIELPDDGSGATDPLSDVREVEAGEVAQHLLGVETYRIHVDLDAALMDVELLGADGDGRGNLVLEVGPDMPSSQLKLTTPSGASATVVPHQIEHYDGQVTVIRRFESEGAVFRTVARIAANGDVEEVAYDAGGPEDAMGQGGIVITKGETSEPTETVRQWLDDNAASLQQSEAMNALYVVMSEPVWLETIADMVGTLEGVPTEGATQTEGDLGTSQQGIHKSPLCASLIAVLAVGGVLTAVCAACGTSAAALPATAGWSALAAIPSCVWCAAGVGLSIADLFACFISYYTAKNANDCVSECSSWEDASVAANEHDCVCTCNSNKCDKACEQKYGNDWEGNGCLNNTCKCRKKPSTTSSSSSTTSSSSSSTTSSGATGGYGGTGGTGGTGGVGGTGGSATVSSSSSSSTGGAGGSGGTGGAGSTSSSGGAGGAGGSGGSTAVSSSGSGGGVGGYGGYGGYGYGAAPAN